MKTSRFLLQKLSTISCSAVMSLSYNGDPITDIDDCEMIRDAFYLWCLAIWDLADPSSHNRLYDTLPQLYYKLCGCDIALLVKLLDDIRSAFYSMPPNTSLLLDVFKGRNLGGSLSSGHVIMPMREHCDRSDRSSKRALNSILCFLLKLNIRMRIEQKLEEEYIHDEERISFLDFDEPLIDDVTNVITSWFKDYKSEVIIPPHHGPGAVAGFSRLPISEKYPLLGVDQRLEYWLKRDRPDYQADYVRKYVNFERKAEVVFVPKSLKTYRVICKEPATLQYWQQALAQNVTEYIHNHKTLSKKINLRDQELSRSFCRFASRSRDYATIDLSKASDSVSLALIKRIFRHTPLLRGLIATRSDSVLLPSGKELQSSKFAPMGSALCFPIECVVFAALCEVAIAYSSGKKSRYRVYGDDIIIHHSHVPNLMIILEKTGFLPNKEKSYFSRSCSYRESCGEEAIDGFSVAPVRLSRSFRGLRPKRDTDIPRLIDLSNSLFQYGLMTTRKAVVRSLLQLENPPLFSVPNGIGIWSFSPTNFSIKRRMINGEKGFRHGALVSIRSRVKLENDDIRLHEWFRQGGSPDGPINIEKVRVVWRAITSPMWFSTIEVAKVKA